MTHEESSLLRAIVLAPDDLALRLIYADWCEEHGRLARATFIRAQCLLDPFLVPVNPPNSHNSDPRFLHASGLAPKVRWDLLEPFHTMAGLLGWDLEYLDKDSPVHRGDLWISRGFVERLTLMGLRRLGIWVQHGAEIMDRIPLQLLTLWVAYDSEDDGFLPAGLLQNLLDLEGTRRLRALDLSLYLLDSGAAQVLLTAGKEWPVQWLSIRTRDIPDSLRDDLQTRFGDALRMIPSSASEDDIPF